MFLSSDWVLGHRPSPFHTNSTSRINWPPQIQIWFYFEKETKMKKKNTDLTLNLKKKKNEENLQI